MKETEGVILATYLNKYIDKQARVSSKLAAQSPNPEDDPKIDEAIYFDCLAHEPTPWFSPDDHDPEDLDGEGK